LLGALFFLGYFLFQVPGAAYAQRKSVRRIVFIALLSWDTLAALTGVILIFWLLALDRTLLGNPTTMLWMSAITGWLIKQVGWQMTFILEGIPSVLWAFVWLAVVRDRAQNIGWLSDDSCAQLNLQLEQEQRTLPQM
jgi:hypothetical protein